MSRALIVLAGKAERVRAHAWIENAPANTRVEFKKAQRTLPQNDLMWALLTDISRQVVHFGAHMTPDDWKLIFLDALKRELRTAPNLDGNGFVNLGRSSSDLSKDEMSDLIELIREFGARQGVIFGGDAMDSQARSGSREVAPA